MSSEEIKSDLTNSVEESDSDQKGSRSTSQPDQQNTKHQNDQSKSEKKEGDLTGQPDAVIAPKKIKKGTTADNEGKQSVKNEKQNSFYQNNDNLKGLVDVETVKRLVAEELSKDKRSFTKMQTGLISFAFFLGGGMMSYWWTPHYTNTTYVLSDNTTHNTSIVMEDVTQKLLQCQANLTQIKDDFNHVQDNFIHFKNDVTEVSNGITGTIEGVKEELKDDFLLLKRDMNILTGTQQIQDNRYITYSETIFFLLAGLILEPLLIFFLLYKYFPWRNGSHHGPDAHVHDGPNAQPQFHGVQHNRQNQPRRVNILDQICSGNLEESICILSFYGETQDLHHRILTSALQQKDIPMKQFLLKVTDSDALSIPRCHFVFVFVDFNERNVILENPDQELGDKKVVTVKACQKMGADVFVIYTRDRDSGNLGDGKLYNKELSAFTEHFLLKELTAKDRGLSVNDTFTPYQKRHIRRIVLKK
ncbi:unnamed protein product [Mytilus coruscus]|uniref:Uncharacterized protein n=1 Tax=Mytilus coruscus TaxID=42192 RepID=A0A6J8EQD0_MYTCO|nr:unnamed protein product [Mytilus coruscus]